MHVGSHLIHLFGICNLVCSAFLAQTGAKPPLWYETVDIFLVQRQATQIFVGASDSENGSANDTGDCVVAPTFCMGCL